VHIKTWSGAVRGRTSIVRGGQLRQAFLKDAAKEGRKTGGLLLEFPKCRGALLGEGEVG